MQLFSRNEDSTDTIWVPDSQINSSPGLAGLLELKERIVEPCSVSGKLPIISINYLISLSTFRSVFRFHYNMYVSYIDFA